MLSQKIIYPVVILLIGLVSCVSDSTNSNGKEGTPMITQELSKSGESNNNSNSQKQVISNSSSNQSTSASMINEKTAEAKNDINSEVSQNKTTRKPEPKKNKKAIKAGPLPDACTLVDEPFIAKTINVNADAITIKDGSISASSTARSCFFRWEHKGVPNSGVLVQIQENPLPDEIDNWAAYFIQAKINSGDTDPTGALNYKYKPFDGIGINGAYNYDMHRYFFRIEGDKVFMIAFNIVANEKDELSWAQAIGREVLKNYNSL